MKTIAEQIADFEATRQAKAARGASIMQKSADEGRTLDDSEETEYDGLAEEIKRIDSHIQRLKQQESLMVVKAETVEVKKAPGQVEKTSVEVKNTQKLDKGIEFARYAMCLLSAKGDPGMARQIAVNRYPDNPRIIKTLEMQAAGGDLAEVMKADVAAGTTLQTTWAAPLVDYQTYAGDFVEFLRPQTIIGKFGMGNVPSLNRIPFNVRIAGQTSGGQGYWVGEGAPKPLTKFDFNAVELRWAKVANIAVLTQELMRFSNPSAERLVRDALAAALIERLDIDFIDPGKALVANVSPASITNGVSPLSPSGSDAAALRRDLLRLWAPFIAANNPPTTAVYIMSATLALSISVMRNDLDTAPAFPGMTMNGGTLDGIPVIVSEYTDNSAGSSGSLLILANARDIWLADDGQVTIDASREASLQMLDNPTNNSATPTATSMVSMFQTNSVALRAERFINWQKRRTSAVAYIDGANYAPS